MSDVQWKSEKVIRRAYVSFGDCLDKPEIAIHRFSGLIYCLANEVLFVRIKLVTVLFNALFNGLFRLRPYIEPSEEIAGLSEWRDAEETLVLGRGQNCQ